MKKLLLLSMIAVATLGSKAQDFKKVNTVLVLNKMEDAKVELDKMSADPKALAKTEYWYYRSRIYANLGKEAKTASKYPTAIQDADAAFQKLVALDPAWAMVKDKGNDGIFDMYSYGYNNGIRAFNDKKWDSASSYFGYAVTYSDILFKNKMTKDQNMAFDTTSLLYAGYSSQNAQKGADACKYYARLAEAKVGGEGFVDIYKYLVITYMNDKKEDLFRKYIALAKQVYPKENWDDYEIEYIDRNFSLAEKEAFYDKGDIAGSFGEMQYLQFGEIFVNVKNDAKEKDKYDSTKLDAYEKKGIEAYKKAFAKNPNNAIASFNIGVIYYNNFGLLDDKIAANIKTVQMINSSKPTEKDPVKKKALDAKFKAQTDPLLKANQDLEKPINETLDQAIDWLEKTYKIESEQAKLTPTDRSIGNKSVDFLANIYGYKRDRVRGKDAKSFDQYENKYKQFDNLHDSFTDNKINQKANKTNENETTNSGNSVVTYGQVKLNKEGGVYTVKAQVNGLDWDLIFDTGASNVSISLAEANYMLKHNKLFESDIIGKQKFSTADGTISEGTIIILREIKLGGITLKDVRATVVHTQSAPILLGQSALSRFGRITIDYEKSILILNK